MSKLSLGVQRTRSGPAAEAAPIGALAVIPQGVSLVEREPQVAAWIGRQVDPEEIAGARALLAAWRSRAERGSAEADAAIRLDIRCERRLGQLPEARPLPAGRPEKSGQPVRNSPAEGRSLSRARALAAIPARVFDAKLAEPKPSRAKMLAEAVLPTAERTVDPVLEELAQAIRVTRLPAPESWPDRFDTGLLDEKAVQTVRGAQDSWRRWCDRWDEALAAVPQMRRVK